MSKSFGASSSIIGRFNNATPSKTKTVNERTQPAKTSIFRNSNYSITFAETNLRPKGLQNLTNTCYISAILQVLFPIIRVQDFPLKSNKKLTSLFFRLKETKLKSDYKQFKQVLDERIGIVYGWEQQDAHEFLVHLLEEFSKQNALPLATGNGLNLNYNYQFNFAKNWQLFNSEMLKIENSRIVRLFSGEILKRLTCEDGGHIKNKFQRFNNISLSFLNSNTSTSDSGPLKLQKMVKDYFSIQEIQDIQCQKCQAKKTFKKSAAIYSGSKFLILHLSRFIKGYLQNEKNDTEISFNASLIMNSFREKHIQYKLIGIVHHTGTLDSGHYYADVLISGTWYQMDDQKVYQQEIKQQQNVSNTAYLLIYEKIEK